MQLGARRRNLLPSLRLALPRGTSTLLLSSVCRVDKIWLVGYGRLIQNWRIPQISRPPSSTKNGIGFGYDLQARTIGGSPGALTAASFCHSSLGLFFSPFRMSTDSNVCGSIDSW